MKHYLSVFFAILSFVSVEAAAEIPKFHINSDDIANTVLEATPNKPWIFSITLTEKGLRKYEAFTKANLNSQISLIVTGVEIYRPLISEPFDENPLTFRMIEKDKFISILSALSKDPE